MSEGVRLLAEHLAKTKLEYEGAATVFLPRFRPR